LGEKFGQRHSFISQQRHLRSAPPLDGGKNDDFLTGKAKQAVPVGFPPRHFS
jgi:hypothetical protein